MAKLWPALDVWNVDADLLVAFLDEFHPTALEQRGSAVRIFFSTPRARDDAASAIPANPLFSSPRHESIDVSDEDWARRSQETLRPVSVGRIVIVPDSNAPERSSSPIAIVIPPSMAFGTGHHATTRLCLAALQTIDLSGATVVDVGTGSGVLAIAAVALGAGRAHGIDSDADAIEAAKENVARNRHIAGTDRVTVECASIETIGRPEGAPAKAGPYKSGGGAHVVTANLTGALLASQAQTLMEMLRPEGRLIVSGLLADEWDDVIQALGGAMKKVWQEKEDGWIGAVLMKK